MGDLGREDPLEKDRQPKYSCLENPMGRAAWQATVHEVTDTAERLNIIYTPGGASGKESACQCRRHRRCRFSPGWGRSGEGNGSRLQCSCLENPMDRGACPWRDNPWGCQESDMTQHLSTRAYQFSLIRNLFMQSWRLKSPRICRVSKQARDSRKLKAKF